MKELIAKTETTDTQRTRVNKTAPGPELPWWWRHTQGRGGEKLLCIQWASSSTHSGIIYLMQNETCSKTSHLCTHLRRLLAVCQFLTRPCHGVPSLRLSMRSDCHTNEPGSLGLRSSCKFGSPVDSGFRPGRVTALSNYWRKTLGAIMVSVHKDLCDKPRGIEIPV